MLVLTFASLLRSPRQQLSPSRSLLLWPSSERSPGGLTPHRPLVLVFIALIMAVSAYLVHTLITC